MDSGSNRGDDRRGDGFFRPLKPAQKVVLFVALLTLFWALGGFELNGRRELGRVLLFVVGAVFALWVRPEPVGTLRQIRFDAFIILLGCLAMLWALAMMLLTRDIRRPSRPEPRSHGPSGAKTMVAVGEVRFADETHGARGEGWQPRSG